MVRYKRPQSIQRMKWWRHLLWLNRATEWMCWGLVLLQWNIQRIKCTWYSIGAFRLFCEYSIVNNRVSVALRMIFSYGIFFVVATAGLHMTNFMCEYSCCSRWLWVGTESNVLTRCPLCSVFFCCSIALSSRSRSFEKPVSWPLPRGCTWGRTRNNEGERQKNVHEALLLLCCMFLLGAMIFVFCCVLYICRIELGSVGTYCTRTSVGQVLFLWCV